MAGRTGRRRVNSSSPLVDLDVVFADDELVDAIAARPWRQPCHAAVGGPSVVGGADRFRAQYPHGSVLVRDPLFDLFESWRDELSLEPLPEPPLISRFGPSPLPAKVPAKRSLRAALSIAAAIAALLVGSASLGSKEATQESALWPITEMLWPDRVDSVASASRAREAIDLARVALKDGRSADAQGALVQAEAALVDVQEVDGRTVIAQELATLRLSVDPYEFVDQSPVVVAGGSTRTGSVLPSPSIPAAAGLAALAVDQPALSPPLSVADGLVAAGPIGLPPSAAGTSGLTGARQLWAGSLIGDDPAPQAVAAAARVGGPSSVSGPSALEPAAVEPAVGESVAAGPSAAESAPVGSAALGPAAPAVTPVPAADPPPVDSAPSTPPLPTAPAQAPTELPSNPPTATEQSAPAPTPSANPQQDETVLPADGVPLSLPPEDAIEIPVTTTAAAVPSANAEPAATSATG